MPDLADFADELAVLVQEFLDADVGREEIQQTLTAKAQELEAEAEKAEDDSDAPSSENEDG